jgi:hypothetical protein
MDRPDQHDNHDRAAGPNRSDKGLTGDGLPHRADKGPATGDLLHDSERDTADIPAIVTDPATTEPTGTQPKGAQPTDAQPAGAHATGAQPAGVHATGAGRAGGAEEPGAGTATAASAEPSEAHSGEGRSATSVRFRRSHKRPKPIKVGEHHFDWLWELVGLVIAIGIALIVFFTVPMIVTP